MTICAAVILTEAASASSSPDQKRRSVSGLQLPGDSEIRQIISDRIKGFENRVSITVGIIGPQGRRTSYGSSGTKHSAVYYRRNHRRDRIDHEGFHLIAVGRYGGSWRGRA